MRLGRGLLAVAAITALLAGTAGPLPAQAATPAAGKVVAWGFYNSVPNGLGEVTAVSAGSSHSIALRRDGTVAFWGDTSYRQGNVPKDLTDVTAISAGDLHNLAMRSDGTVVAWGYNASGESTVPKDLTGVTAISANGAHSLALRGDGTVVAWGDPNFGMNTVPNDVTDVIAISAGAYYSLALRSDGTVAGWGSNYGGESIVPKDLTDVTAISAGRTHSLALRSDGTVVAWGSNYGGESTVPKDLVDVTAISAGKTHSLALRSDGTVVAWGSDPYYGLSTVPDGLTRVTAIDASSYHNLVIGTPPPAFTADAPPTTADLGAPYSYAFAADGGTTFELASGSLPAGLTLSLDGVLSGTPTATGDFTFTVSAHNAFGRTTGTPHTITVTPVAPTISGTAAAGVVGSAYDYSYTVTGVPAPEVTVTSGTLPPGLTLDTTGRLTGTPTATGGYNFTVAATNIAGTTTADNTLTITPATIGPTISGVVAAGIVGSAYDYSYIVTGTPTPEVSVASGTLPPGLALDKTGRLTGTPTKAGTYRFTVQATNSAGTATAEQSTLTISPKTVTTKADLRVDVSAPSTAGKNTTFAYTLITKNAGPSTSTSVYSKVILPLNVKFVSATGKYTRIGNVVIFQRSNLTNGQTVTEKITVKATGTGKGTALAATFSVKTPDPSIRSNADTAATTVR